MKKFFDPYDAPNNAVLAMVGDLETAEARKWVENYFGGIKSSQLLPRPDLTEPQSRKRKNGDQEGCAGSATGTRDRVSHLGAKYPEY